MEFDANAKLGCGIIVNDPNVMSSNGQILYDMQSDKILHLVIYQANAQEQLPGIAVPQIRKKKQ